MTSTQPKYYHDEIDGYSIFELMGLNDISDKEKNTIIAELNALVWTGFTTERLPHILTQPQLDAIYADVTENKSLDAISTHITSYAPNFPQLLAEYTRAFKVDFISKHFIDKIKEYEKFMALKVNKKNFEMLKTEQQKMIKALQLLQAEEWDLLCETLSSGSEKLNNTTIDIPT